MGTMNKSIRYHAIVQCLKNKDFDGYMNAYAMHPKPSCREAINEVAEALEFVHKNYPDAFMFYRRERQKACLRLAGHTLHDPMGVPEL